MGFIKENWFKLAGIVLAIFALSLWYQSIKTTQLKDYKTCLGSKADSSCYRLYKGLLKNY